MRFPRFTGIKAHTDTQSAESDTDLSSPRAEGKGGFGFKLPKVRFPHFTGTAAYTETQSAESDAVLPRHKAKAESDANLRSHKATAENDADLLWAACDSQPWDLTFFSVGNLSLGI